MGLRDFLAGGKLRISWKYVAEGQVWRVMPDATHFFVCEDRDREQKSTSFFCIDGLTGSLLWKDVRIEEQWWVGLEGIHRDVVYLHKFASPDMPGHKGIIALDLSKGNLLWRDDDAVFLRVDGDTVVAGKLQPTGLETVALHYKTGKESPLLRETEHSTTDDLEATQFPIPLELVDEELRSRIAKVISPSSLSVEVYATNQLAIISHHEKEGKGEKDEPSFSNFLRVLDMEKSSVLFEERLAVGAPSPVADTFFIRGEMLYYVKDRKIFTGVRLSGNT